MKKIIYSLGLALTLASCSEAGYEDWANPQSNAAEDQVTVKLTVANAPAVDYATLTEDSVQLFIPTVEYSDNEVPTNSYVAVLKNGEKSFTIETDATGKAAAADLKDAVESLYGKRPEKREIPMEVTGISKSKGLSVKNTTTATATATLTAPHFIDEEYYLAGDMFDNGWSKEGAKKLTHVGNGDVYDYPEWNTILRLPEGRSNWYWKIIPLTNYNGEFFGDGVAGTLVDGDNAFEGNLTTVEPKAGRIEEPGTYRLSINMWKYTYKIEKLNFEPFIYEIGSESEWKTSHALSGENFDGNYQGYYYLNGEFKFKPKADTWDDDFGQDPNSTEKKLVSKDEENIKADAGFYQINVNYAEMTYNLVKVESISAIGSFSDWASDIDLTYNTEEGCWEGELDITKNSEFKFRMNHDWKCANWGGDVNNLKQDGANINIAKGKYNIKLYLSYAGANKVKITKL